MKKIFITLIFFLPIFSLPSCVGGVKPGEYHSASGGVISIHYTQRNDMYFIIEDANTMCSAWNKVAYGVQKTQVGGLFKRSEYNLYKYQCVVPKE